MNADEIFLEGRLSYTYIFKPYEGDNGDSYCTHVIFEPNAAQVEKLSAIIRTVAKNKWKDEADAVLAALKGQDRLCLHRGDVSKAGQEPYKGKLFVSASRKGSDGPPTILATIDGLNQRVDSSHPLAPYSGCKARVHINVWAQANTYGKRVNAGLLGVQFLDHDIRLGGSGRTSGLDEYAPVNSAGADAPVPASAGAGLV